VIARSDRPQPRYLCHPPIVDACTYRIVVAGELGRRFDRAFEGMTVTAEKGQTTITGVVADRAQLRGVLDRIDDLGLTLVEVTSVAAEATVHGTG
jgi:hypothetical protein